MNMEEWQRKQKAEKEAARQKKSESAEILHGYRGDLKDDELKLKAIRDEERRKAQDAQQILHNYKGSQLPDGVKPKEQRTEQHFPTPVNAGQGPHRDDVLDAIVMGSVSERAAALAAAAASDGSSSVPLPSSSSRHTISRTVAPIQGNVNASVPADDDDDDDEDFGPSFQTNQNISSGNETNMLQQPQSDLLLSQPILSTKTNFAPYVISDEIEPKLSTPIEESLRVEKPLETIMSNVTSSVAAASLEGIISMPQQSLQRMDLLLAFGLVTISSPPNLEDRKSVV